MTSMNEEICDFCDELKGGKQHLIASLFPQHQDSRIVLRRGNLFAIPCLGSIEFGHALIVPDYHIQSFLSLNPEDHDDFRQVVVTFCRAYFSYFGKQPTFFEHGDPNGLCESQGPCISHAHIHVAPNGDGMLSRIFPERQLLKSQHLTDGGLEIDRPYLMCTQADLNAQYFDATGTPRQYLRRIYSENIGRLDAWNWAANIDLETTFRDAIRLRKLLDFEMNDHER